MPQQHQKPIAKWNSGRDCWETDQVDLLSGLSDVYSETFTISGSMRNGVAYEHQTAGHHRGASGSLFSQLGGKLLPTVTAQDSAGSGGSNDSNVTLTDAVVRTEFVRRPNPRLLPTPRTTEAAGIGSHGAGGQDLRTAVALLPTPTAERPDGRKSDAFRDGRANFYDIINADRWGEYAVAIARWEAVFMRIAPEPTEEAPKGGRRLSAAFVEWMMGLPEGWATDPSLGLSRTQQLKMLGNGVVTQQAVAAINSMTKGLNNAF